MANPSLRHDQAPDRCETGIDGLDEILCGGLPKDSLYVVQGEAGSGKTTLAMQFLIQGVRRGERVLYITLSETREELVRVSESHGFDLAGIDVVDLARLEEHFSSYAENSLFHPAEIELNRITDRLLEEIAAAKPVRMVFDSVSEMRLLAETPLRYRRQILALKQVLARQKITVLFLDDMTGTPELQVQSIAHGVIDLSRLKPSFGAERRILRVLKLRGVDFTSGNHDFVITKGGLEVYPRLVASDFKHDYAMGRLESGSRELDALLGGGLDYGTSNLILGPAGTGKSSICATYALAALETGKKVGFFCFDETVTNFYRRGSALGMDFGPYIESGRFLIQAIDPAELTPGAFSAMLQNLVAEVGVSLVVIDSLNGYIQAMPEENYLSLQLHELLAYLNNQGVVTLLTLAQHGLVGSMRSPVDLTYLTDTVVLTRFFEASGAIKKAISVLKKRTGEHEKTIREFVIGKRGLEVGPALRQFSGVLTGVPKYFGTAKETMHTE